MKYFLLTALIFVCVITDAQVRLQNICNTGNDSVLARNSENRFRLIQLPEKKAFSLSCSSCSILFEGYYQNMMSITPGESESDTVFIYLDNNLAGTQIFHNTDSASLHIMLQSFPDSILYKSKLNQEKEVIITAGKPGCASKYVVTSFNISFQGHRNEKVKGNKLSDAYIKLIKLLSAGSVIQIHAVKAKLKDGPEQIIGDISYVIKE